MNWDQHVAEQFMLFLSEMETDKQRLEAIHMVQSAFCFYCGRMLGEREAFCHCMNDE